MFKTFQNVQQFTIRKRSLRLMCDFYGASLGAIAAAKAETASWAPFAVRPAVIRSQMIQNIVLILEIILKNHIRNTIRDLSALEAASIEGDL